MSSSYYNNLIEKVSHMSQDKDWCSAITEWDIVDCDEDHKSGSTCICGKENLRYRFRIKNMKNNNILYPIGSCCIKKFERNDLNEKTLIQEKLFKLFHAVKEKKYITLSKDLFSRKLLKYLYDEGVFKATKYNRSDPKNDYQFMIKMFNKRKKSEITKEERNKITAIIMSSILPYLKEQLSNKIIV